MGSSIICKRSNKGTGWGAKSFNRPIYGPYKPKPIRVTKKQAIYMKHWQQWLVEEAARSLNKNK